MFSTPIQARSTRSLGTFGSDPTKTPYLRRQPAPDKMGLFSKSSSNRTSSKPSISERSASLASSNSSLQSPTLGFGKRSSQPTSSAPFSPTTTAPSHRPQIPMPKAPDPLVDPAAYLRSIGSVRARCSVLLEKAVDNKLNHFDVDMSKFDDTVAFVVSIIKVPLL